MRNAILASHLGLACVATLLLVGEARAFTQPDQSILVGPQTPQTAPIVEKPTTAQIVGSFPDAAVRANKSGSVVVHCTIGENGRLHDCAVVTETPSGYGFGDAALGLMRFFKLKGRFGPDASINMPFTYAIAD